MNSKRELQVGITVIVSFIVLIVGLIWLKQVNVGSGETSYNVMFNGVGGLQVHDRIQVRGIRMGAVKSLDFSEDGVLVVIAIHGDADLRNDAEIRLQTVGIVGEKLIEIDPGMGTPVESNHTFKGVVDADMTAMMSTGAIALDDAQELTKEIRALVKELRNQGKLTGTMDAGHDAATKISTLVDDVSPGLKQLVTDLKGSVEKINSLVGDEKITSAIAGADRTFAKTDTLTILLTDVTASLAKVVAKMESGEGSLGKLIHDETLYAEADSTIMMVQDLIADIKARPKRYFHITLF
ncbi:MCE family protein [bacterium]|mgnify:CR=1 FL=1|jgi:phospholipid/cholesterol/gamma-HCH transport system substrate-binding protein|nr:MCE family protein [bacterium]MBT4291960.1 MCE family protein [bacterium]